MNFQTNSAWKCSNTYSVGWESVSFDDSGWPQATVIQRNGVNRQKLEDIRDDAWFIWAPKYFYGPGSDNVVYCRVKPAGVQVCQQSFARLIASKSKETPPRCLDQNLVITVDDVLELYLDGNQVKNLPNYNKVDIPDTVKISPSVKVIAVKATNLIGSYGILASGTTFISESSWKCTNKYEVGWETTYFDDSHWPFATEVTQNGYGGLKPKVADIKDWAYWIWTSKNSDTVVYCRFKPAGVLICPQLFAEQKAANPEYETLPACADQDLVITVDNQLDLFIDGNLVPDIPNAHNWRKTDTVKIPAMAQVIAVKGTNTACNAGILASGANFISDTSWKCTNDYSAGWESVSFDDSHWPPAVVYAKNGFAHWSLLSDINDDAGWIWTSTRNDADFDKEVYCRARLPACNRFTVISGGESCSTSCDYRLCSRCSAS